MTISPEDLQALQVRLVPVLVPLLRELRTVGADPRSRCKQLFETAAGSWSEPTVATRVAFFTRLGLVDNGSVAPEAFNQCVDDACLQL
jgi:hypothetical protein